MCQKILNNEIIDDIDIATTLSPEELKEKLKDTEFKTIDTGLEHGSLTITCNSNKFEVTTLRKDIKTDGRHAEIEYTNDWEQDLLEEILLLMQFIWIEVENYLILKMELMI